MKMNQLCTMTLAIVITCGSFASAQCVVDDDSFATADGGCKDLGTGLVWSPDLRGIGYFYAPNSNVQSYCNEFFNNSPDGHGYTDWRPPTVGETQQALANGLYAHLDYFLDGSPGIHSYYWTTCRKLKKGSGAYQGTYAVRHQDGAIRLSTSAENALVCVRGLPADNVCPVESSPGGGKGGKGNKTSFLSRPAATGLLTLPLTMMAAVWGLKRRWA